MVLFFGHLVPSHAPLFLGFLLFWVECLSRFIRPFTLVLRLCANMLAGHVLLSVFSGIFVWVLFGFWSYVALPLYFFCVMFFLFELGICFVQAGVFGLLLFTYFSEGVC